jgi:hypothetical protein
MSVIIASRRHGGGRRPCAACEARQQRERAQWSLRRTGVVRRSMESKGAARCDASTASAMSASRRANALSHAIGQPDRQHLPNALRQPDQRANDRRNSIARDHERLSPRQPVGPPPTRQLQQRRD